MYNFQGGKYCPPQITWVFFFHFHFPSQIVPILHVCSLYIRRGPKGYFRSTMVQLVSNKTAIKIPGKRTRNTTNLDVAARKKYVSSLPIYK